MEVSTTLIVILMFASIVGIGVGQILMTLSSLVTRFVRLRERAMATMWLLILLVTFLGMFWSATILANREEWSFALFLFAIAGPVLLLFATSLIAAILQQNPDDGAAADDVESPLLSRFFWMLAATHAWVIGMDFVLGNGWTFDTAISTLLCTISAILAMTSNRKLRWIFTIATLVATAADIGLTSV